MHFPLLTFFIVAGVTTFFLTALSLLITTRLHRASQSLKDFCVRAPGLDLIVGLFSWIPWVVGAASAGWRGLLGVIAGQVATYFIWVAFHEQTHRQALGGPRIVKFINRTVGRWQNHAALWGTMLALPAFLHVRLIEVTIYPFLVWVLKFPAYRQGDWISVSRQKFDGLIGHDLFWCLYCDWMTGVTALCVEMLRNVESFWRPIRFGSGKKCENCKLDFPDIHGGWVPADGTMREVEATLERMYSSGQRSWYGHPSRLPLRTDLHLTVLGDGGGNSGAAEEGNGSTSPPPDGWSNVVSANGSRRWLKP